MDGGRVKRTAAMPSDDASGPLAGRLCFTGRPRRLLQRGPVVRPQTIDFVVCSHRVLVEQRSEEDARGKVGARRSRMTLIAVVQRWLIVRTEKSLPGQADWND